MCWMFATLLLRVHNVRAVLHVLPQIPKTTEVDWWLFHFFKWRNYSSVRWPTPSSKEVAEFNSTSQSHPAAFYLHGIQSYLFLRFGEGDSGSWPSQGQWLFLRGWGKNESEEEGGKEQPSSWDLRSQGVYSMKPLCSEVRSLVIWEKWMEKVNPLNNFK